MVCGMCEGLIDSGGVLVLDCPCGMAQCWELVRMLKGNCVSVKVWMRCQWAGV